MLREVDHPSIMIGRTYDLSHEKRTARSGGDLGKGRRERRLTLANPQLQWGFGEGSRGGLHWSLQSTLASANAYRPGRPSTATMSQTPTASLTCRSGIYSRAVVARQAAGP